MLIMKELKDIFNESLLDDDGGEDLYQFADRLKIAKEYHEKVKSTNRRAAVDIMGNTLEIGDLVIFARNDGYLHRTYIGVVVYIRGAYVTICFDGNVKGIPKDASGGIKTIYLASNLLKINEDIAKQLIKL